MKSSHPSAWLLSVGLVIVGACKSDGGDAPAADPLADPWVDAVETGADEPVLIADPEALPGDQDSASIAEARPPAAELAMPVVDEAESTTANSHAPATSRNSTAAADVHEAPAIDEQPAEPAPEPTSAPGSAPAPEPVVEPKSTPSAEPSPAPITSADFDGSWRYVGGKAQRDDVAAAIEATVEQLARAIQGIARKRLTQANPVDNVLDIVVAGDKITTTFESGFTVTCVIDGATVHTTGNEGEKLAVRVRSKDSKIVQIMQGKDGARTVVYVLSADRKKLTVHHKITADRLPEPLTYRLSYARK